MLSPSWDKNNVLCMHSGYTSKLAGQSKCSALVTHINVTLILIHIQSCSNKSQFHGSSVWLCYKIIRSITPLRAVFVSEGGNTWGFALFVDVDMVVSLAFLLQTRLICEMNNKQCIYFVFHFIGKKYRQSWLWLSQCQMCIETLTTSTNDAICDRGT